MPSRLKSESGFTLIELLVVVVIIGMLAAITLPMIIGQRLKGQDADAKSNARNLAGELESCQTTYEIVAHSRSGSNFTYANLGAQVFERTCTTASGGDAGGCRGNVW